MRRASIGICLWAVGCVAAAAEEPLVPQMNVKLGPETVFLQAPTELFPALAGAQRTEEAGRVGNEMVFWGYHQKSGARVFLFACAQVAEVDCQQRAQAVCSNVKVLDMQMASGNVVRRTCRTMATTAPGDVRPGCDDRVEPTPLAIGVLSCG